MKALILIIAMFFVFASSVDATSNPTSRPNNAMGIHILFTHELENAAKMINSNGGEWGYVTIPIQINDLDRVKWQGFMDEARERKIIPIIRVATEPWYQNTAVWKKPTLADIHDFANFLDGLAWPTKTRYVILFNEVNRFDEWQGEAPNPQEYAGIVLYAQEVFKRKSTDFFLITAGMDNASPNDRVKYMDNLVYLREMGEYNADVFAKIDGISSHSYPNPAFAQPPSTTKTVGTSTYKFENALVKGFAGVEKPVFITETGWDVNVVGEERASSYLSQAFNFWLSDPNVVAITPFLLESGAGPFVQFTFMRNGEFTKMGEAVAGVSKITGEPELNNIGGKTEVNAAQDTEKTRFAYINEEVFNSDNTPRVLKSYFKMLLGVN